MSILIKGMEMPTRCADCRFHKSIYCALTDICTNTAQGCPLVPVPPHGRLIDADELFKEMERKGWFDNADRDIAEDLVLAAPTIIQAEEGE